MTSEFYKENPDDVIWQVDTSDRDGEFLFSFDKKEVFNLFRDYPYKLTAEQKKLFDKQFPFWAVFLRTEQCSYETTQLMTIMQR